MQPNKNTSKYYTPPSPIYKPPFKCIEVDLIYCDILKLINKKTVNTISILISSAVDGFEVHFLLWLDILNPSTLPASYMPSGHPVGKA